MQDNNEVKAYIEAHSEKFVLAPWCSPRSLNLSASQLKELLKTVEAQLPPHLVAIKKLRISLQASSENTDSESQCASVQIYTLHSELALISFEATLSAENIAVKIHDTRPLAVIRKLSLQGHNKPTILIVDDDPPVRMTLNRWINKEYPHYEILCARSAEEGIKLYQANFHCCCIFMDIQMPEMDGFEVSKRIREFDNRNELKSCPIIFISADEPNPKMADFENTTFCAKPLKQDVCIHTLKEIIDAQKLIQDVEEPLSNLNIK